MMCQMKKNIQSYRAIFGMSERGRVVERSEERERVDNERPQERVSISVEKIRKQCRKIPNWKAPGRDGVQGY